MRRASVRARASAERGSPSNSPSSPKRPPSSSTATTDSRPSVDRVATGMPPCSTTYSPWDGSPCANSNSLRRRLRTLESPLSASTPSAGSAAKSSVVSRSLRSGTGTSTRRRLRGGAYRPGLRRLGGPPFVRYPSCSRRRVSPRERTASSEEHHGLRRRRQSGLPASRRGHDRASREEGRLRREARLPRLAAGVRRSDADGPGRQRRGDRPARRHQRRGSRGGLRRPSEEGGEDADQLVPPLQEPRREAQERRYLPGGGSRPESHHP